MQLNDVINGFKVTRIRPVAEQNGTLIEMEHIKTGAQLVWLKRDESNKTFAISFKTVPTDSTGVFHILEHSVLNGSEKYPTKEPFVDLIKNSLNTFLNAFTFPDKTVYPVSSRNEKDFENLIRVYLDAVFHPAIHYCREIFDQEGWHYEPTQDGTGFIRNGVVLNEMKGAYSSVNSVMFAETDKLLFPNNCYQYESGGHPDSIPKLTYEQFVETHRKFYHPSNSRIFIDGDVPIERILKLADEEYLSSYEKKICNFDIPVQGKKAPSEKTVTYSASESGELMSHLVKSYVIGSFEEKEKNCAVGLLVDYLTSNNDAPLNKAVLEQGLAQNVEAFVNSEVLQPYLGIVFRNMKQENKGKIEELFTDTLRTIRENGVDKKRMHALIDRTEFQLREQSFGGMPTGIGLALNVLASWNYGGDPIQNLEYEEMLRSLREKTDSGYFDKLIDKLFFESENQATVLLIPDAGLEETRRKAEAEEIEKEIGKLSEDEKNMIAKRFESLCKRQSTPDSEEDIKKIPMLELCDVEKQPARIPTDIHENGSVILHGVPTHGIQYINLYFPLGDIEEARLPEVAAVASLLGDLATEKHTSKELEELLLKEFGKFSVDILPFQDSDNAEKCKVYVRVSCSVLAGKVEKVYELLPEILLHTQFDDEKRIRDSFNQMVESFRQQFIGSGQMLAMKRSNAAITAAGVVSDATSGLVGFDWLQDAIKRFDSDSRKICDGLKEICSRIFTENGLIVSVTGDNDIECANKLHALFPNGGEKQSVCVFAPKGATAEGIEIPAPVSYAVLNTHMSNIHAHITGYHDVLSHLLSLDYLWQEIRVKGGAYGTGIRFTDNGNLAMYSYRDPNPCRSLQMYRNIGEFLRGFLKSDTDLTGVILGTVAKTDPLMTANGMGKFADEMIFRGKTYEDLCAERTEILNTTPEKLLEICLEAEKAMQAASVCVVGGADKIKSCELSVIRQL